MTASPERPAVLVRDMNAARAVVRERGLRMTWARRLVLEALLVAGEPVSADAIARGLDDVLPRTDITTVYRNLETLEAVGIVRHFHAGHGSGRYVLEGSTRHEYLSCEGCGTLETVEPSALHGARDAIRAAVGFEARFSHFPVVGICGDCSASRTGDGGGRHERDSPGTSCAE